MTVSGFFENSVDPWKYWIVFVMKTRGWKARRRQRIAKGRPGQKKASYRGLIHLYMSDMVAEPYNSFLSENASGGVFTSYCWEFPIGVRDFIRGREPDRITQIENTNACHAYRRDNVANSWRSPSVLVLMLSPLLLTE